MVRFEKRGLKQEFVMKKIILAALAASAAFVATPAAAQVTGTVTVTGTVVGRCSVVTEAGGAGTGTFSGTLDLMTLDDPDGTLRDNLEDSTAAAVADGLTVATRVVCTSATPTVEISATKLRTGDGTLGVNGYSDDIDYTAQVVVNTASGGLQDRHYNTGTGAAPAGEAASGALTDRIAAGAANNVTVSVYDLAAENGNLSLLNAGTYNGTITVSIQPGA
jgi:hypothetical protein